MLKKEKKCDGLVISGHYTGSFGGKRAEGSLGINFLENLSCNPKYQDWFNNISAVWLQGCRTLGVHISASEYEDSEETPDFHTRRLEDLLEEDSLEDNLENINLQFSDVLDQDNPLSSRYIRTFPNATTFGWTKTAPGINARSERSLPFHIAQISRTLDNNIPDYFVNPLSLQSDQSKKRYADILVAILSRSKEGNYVYKNRISEETLVNGWLAHGRAIGNFPYSFSNPDLMAYKSMASGRKQLIKAKALGCGLQNSKNSKEDLLFALDKILASESMIYYNLTKIRSILDFLKKDVLLRGAFRKKLMESKNFSNVLYKKLTSKNIGISRLLEYYVLFTQVVEKRNHSYENNILEKAFLILAKGDSSRNYNLRDFKLTLISKLFTSRIINNNFIYRLVPHLKCEPFTTMSDK